MPLTSEREHQLLQAAADGNVSKINELLSDADNVETLLNAADDDEWTALHHAARNHRGAAVAALIEEATAAGGSVSDWVSRKTNHGQTAIMHAVMSSRRGVDNTNSSALTDEVIGILKAILKTFASDAERQAHLAETDGAGLTVLHLAAQCGGGAGGIKVLETLIGTYGMSVDVADGQRRWTPLHHAVADNEPDTVQFLLCKKQASVNAGSDKGHTALMEAAYEGREKIIQMLITAGADVNAADRNGRTALYWATQKKREGAVALLQAEGAVLEGVPKKPEAETAPAAPEDQQKKEGGGSSKKEGGGSSCAIC